MPGLQRLVRAFRLVRVFRMRWLLAPLPLTAAALDGQEIVTPCPLPEGTTHTLLARGFINEVRWLTGGLPPG